MSYLDCLYFIFAVPVRAASFIEKKCCLLRVRLNKVSNKIVLVIIGYIKTVFLMVFLKNNNYVTMLSQFRDLHIFISWPFMY